MHDLASTSVPIADTALEKLAYAKVFRRVVPLIMLCYIVAYLDRINVGFAKLQMEVDLGFSQTVYGLGAGMFFIGYFFFEGPSNLIMYRVGARLWIARIMISWGLLSACFVFVKTPFWFLYASISARRSGGRFLPGCNPLSHLLVPGSAASGDCRHFYVGDRYRGHIRQPAFRLDYGRL
jgi:hypothetical protein